MICAILCKTDHCVWGAGFLLFSEQSKNCNLILKNQRIFISCFANMALSDVGKSKKKQSKPHSSISYPAISYPAISHPASRSFRPRGFDPVIQDVLEQLEALLSQKSPEE